MKNMTNEEFHYIISHENQRRWAALSLEKRCVLFHRKFNDRHITKRVIAKVMKQAGFKKKKVKVQSVPANEEDREEEFKVAILELDNKMH